VCFGRIELQQPIVKGIPCESGTSRRNVLGAVAREQNDRNFPLRRQPSQVPENDHLRIIINYQNRRLRKALPLRSYPDGNRFHLTDSYRNGHIARGRQMSVRCARRSPPPLSASGGCQRAEVFTTDAGNGNSLSAFGGARLRALGGVRPPTSDRLSQQVVARDTH